MKDKEKQYISMREMLTKRSFEPITNYNCRKDKEGAFVDLLNQEIEELQKANAIVEMQNVVCKKLCNQDCRLCNYYNKNDCIQKDNIDALYEQGYRKIDKDSVVLSREEYQEYKKVADGKAIMVENITDLNRLVQFPIEYDDKIFDNIADFGNYVQEQASKETAEKIFNDIFKLEAYDDGWNKLYYKEHIENLTKQFGVEIKE